MVRKKAGSEDRLTSDKAGRVTQEGSPPSDPFREVEAVLRAYRPTPRPEEAALLKQYMSSELEFIGLKVPVQRALAKSPFSFSGGDARGRLACWECVWQESHLFEAMSLALLFLDEACTRHLLPAKTIWSASQRWAVRIENWAHSDTLSSINARCLEELPDQVLPVLELWNTSPEPWLRRQSIVSLHYYSSGRKVLPPYRRALELVERLLEDPHPFVQKGVGWALRELGNVRGTETFAFLREHALRLSSTAFSAATEKLLPEAKAELKMLRKANRKMLR